jgi:putative hemolysin
LSQSHAATYTWKSLKAREVQRNVKNGWWSKDFSLQTRYTDPFRKRLFSIASTVAESLLLLQQFNDIYNNISKNNETNLFLKDVLDNLNIRYFISEGDRIRIPTQGPAIVVANHPFGAIEGIILADILRSRRPDVKIMANHLLNCIPEMRELLIFVDPFGTRDALKSNVKPLKEAIRWVRNGAMLGLFPAGEVSHLRFPKPEITDPEWTETIAGIIRKTGASVIPVYFDGTNSALFQVAGLVHRRLRTVLLPRELLNKSNKNIQVYIGSPVSFERLSAFQTDREVVSYLRFRTYALRHRREKISTIKGGSMPSNPDKKKATVPTSAMVNICQISLEVRNLNQNNVLIENDELAVYHARAHEIPNLLQEIGRLREITFRQIGEGTGKTVDLDRFDLYYTHLFLWNKKSQEVAGAYRLGDVNAIIQRYGENGLYTSTLFHYRPAFLQQMDNALELGRSFIRLEYQKLHSSLFLLWKGIGHFVARHPQHKTLFGPVTISNCYNTLSRQLMVSYLKTNNYTPDVAKLVKPRMPIRLTSLKGRETQAFTTLIKDMEELSGLISDIECDQKGIPVLLRHYLKLGGKMVGFSIDRSFSDGLDGLIMVDLTKCDTKLLRHYMGKEGATAFLAYQQERPLLDLAS